MATYGVSYWHRRPTCGGCLRVLDTGDEIYPGVPRVMCGPCGRQAMAPNPGNPMRLEVSGRDPDGITTGRR